MLIYKLYAYFINGMNILLIAWANINVNLFSLLDQIFFNIGKYSSNM